MKVLGILGSPRRGGNSEILLDRALEAGESVGYARERLILNELSFSPCQECGACARTGRCVINDDMRIIYKRIDAAGAIILASPIFFGSLPAQVKAMIDRYQCRWVGRYVLGKRPPPPRCRRGGLILVSAANRQSFFQNAESIVRNFFSVLDIEFTEKLFCANVEARGKILEHRDCLQKASALGKKVCSAGKAR